MYDGKVIGMHQEGLGALVSKLGLNEVNARHGESEEPALCVIKRVGQGGVGPLASCFPTHMQCSIAAGSRMCGLLVVFQITKKTMCS